MKLKSLQIFYIVSFLSGCAGFQNLTVKDVQQDAYFYKQYELKQSLDQVESSIYEYSTTCRSLGNFMRNPVDKSKAKMTLEQPGFSASSVLTVLDFEEKSLGTTHMKGYTYYSADHSYVDNVVKAINSSKSCE